MDITLGYDYSSVDSMHHIEYSTRAIKSEFRSLENKIQKMQRNHKKCMWRKARRCRR